MVLDIVLKRKDSEKTLAIHDHPVLVDQISASKDGEQISVNNIQYTIESRVQLHEKVIMYVRNTYRK